MLVVAAGDDAVDGDNTIIAEWAVGGGVDTAMLFRLTYDGRLA